MNNWFKLAAKQKNRLRVDIFDEIGGWGITAKEFRDAVSSEEFDELYLTINSPGGSVTEGFAILNYLTGLDQKIIAEVTGMAASMASIIAMAADELLIHENSYLMIHNPWGMTVGGSDEFRKMADLMDDMKASAIKAYQRHTNLTTEEVAEMMDNETWMNGKEAVDNGFADGLMDEIDIAAKFDLSKFENIPDGAKLYMKGETNDSSADSEEEEIIEDDASRSDNEPAKITEPDQSEPVNRESSEDEEIPAEDDTQVTDAENTSSAETPVDESIKNSLQIAENLQNKLNEAVKQIAALETSIAKRDELISRLQSERDRLADNYSEIEAKLEKLVAGGLNYQSDVDSWAEALEKCNGDYVKARKQYPQHFSNFIKNHK